MNSAPTWQGVTIPNPLRLFVILPEKYLTGLLAGGAFAPYELFAAGKTSAQAESTATGHGKVSMWSLRRKLKKEDTLFSVSSFFGARGGT